MARFIAPVYQSPVASPTDAAVVSNLASAASAFMGGGGGSEDELNLRKAYSEKANYQKLLADEAKLRDEAAKLQAERALKEYELERRRGMLTAAQGKDQAALYANIMGLGDAAVMGNYGDANLAAYAAGADPLGSGVLPQADVMRDPILGRLTIGAGHPASTSNIGTVFTQGEETERDANAALQRRLAAESVARTAAAASRYKSDKLGEALGKVTTTTVPAADIAGAFGSKWENMVLDSMPGVILGGDEGTLDPAYSRAVLAHARYLKEAAAARGAILTDSAAIAQAHADVMKASGASALEDVNWNVVDPDIYGLPKIVMPQQPAVTPVPKVTTTGPAGRVPTAAPQAPAATAPVPAVAPTTQPRATMRWNPATRRVEPVLP